VTRLRRDVMSRLVAIGKTEPADAAQACLADRRVEVLGRRDLEALHPGAQGVLSLPRRFSASWFALIAELDDAEVVAARRRQRRFADRPVDAAAARLPDLGDHLQRHVHRIPCVQERPLVVWRTGPATLSRSTGAAALATAS